MSLPPGPPSRSPRWARGWPESAWRLAASGWLPARLLEPGLPTPAELPGRTGRLRIEIVSHCWNYAHLLAYQLSSLVLHPPTAVDVRLTIFYAPEDTRTAELLAFFQTHAVPHVEWHPWPLDRPRLLRRAIGRNLAALASTADWVWFTDCDLIFHRGSLDALGRELQGRRDRLVYPSHEHCTRLLAETDAMLHAVGDTPALVDIDPAKFTPVALSRATGPFQITHGDIARRAGYCHAIPFYQQPVERWRKTYEDRAFRWLLDTPGTPIEVPGLHRIKHVEKGRYHQPRLIRQFRQTLRRLQAVLRRAR